MKELRGQGLGYDAIRERLSGEVSEAAQSPEGEQERPAPMIRAEDARLMLQTLAERERTIEGLQQAVEAQAAHVETLQSQLSREQARADKAEQEAAELRRAMLDQVRRPAPARPWWRFWERDT